ncbi:MAG: ISL3 family transposase [Microthrixaceae bacterium]|mgnify:CR=1 FL=1|nr:MAG: ISL3 family transposase [Gordonia sp. (in: high G+C Gram-positive bacteria)]HNH37814.1 ISL3 family transposase [Microthrixaceae bacterium]HNH96571.1 ISL3 family transposase [Microthrixaceae bacterium]HNK39447.1 ISL3 family transposase [Microthrixaceae bacterium]
MREATIWRRVLGLGEDTVVESVEYDHERDAVIASVRPRVTKRSRKRPYVLACGRCGTPAAKYDDGEGRREWRGLDLGECKLYLEADAPRVSCPEHGVTVARVPWARHGSRLSRDMEDTVAWLACRAAKMVLVALLRITWRTVGAIVDRVVAEDRARSDPFDGLRRIGIDEISYKRGHRYLMVVVDHDTGRLVWAGKGRSKDTLGEFFDLLGDKRCNKIRLVSADAAEFIGAVVAQRCKNATLCTDPFHCVKWATEALDEVRRQVWNDARRAGQRAHAKELKGCRFALWKNPEDLTENQSAKLSWIAQSNAKLYRAYLLKEQFRQVFRLKGKRGITLLHSWLAWACRSRIPAFVKLSRKIRKNLPGIEAALKHKLSNAIVESTNTKLRVLARMAYGFKEPDHLIALALLDRGGHCPPLPGRPAQAIAA